MATPLLQLVTMPRRALMRQWASLRLPRQAVPPGVEPIAPLELLQPLRQPLSQTTSALTIKTADVGGVEGSYMDDEDMHEQVDGAVWMTTLAGSSHIPTWASPSSTSGTTSQQMPTLTGCQGGIVCSGTATGTGHGARTVVLTGTSPAIVATALHAVALWQRGSAAPDCVCTPGWLQWPSNAAAAPLLRLDAIPEQKRALLLDMLTFGLRLDPCDSGIGARTLSVAGPQMRA